LTVNQGVAGSPDAHSSMITVEPSGSRWLHYHHIYNVHRESPARGAFYLQKTWTRTGKQGEFA